MWTDNNQFGQRGNPFATEWKVVGRQERVRAGGREGEGDAPCPPLESSLRRLAPWRRREDVIPVTCSPPRSLDGEDVIAVLRSGARRADRTSLQRRSAPKPFGDPCRRWMKLTSTRELIMVLDKDLSLRHDSPPPRVMLRCGFLLQHLGGFWAVDIALNASAASTGGDDRWPLLPPNFSSPIPEPVPRTHTPNPYPIHPNPVPNYGPYDGPYDGPELRPELRVAPLSTLEPPSGATFPTIFGAYELELNPPTQRAWCRDHRAREFTRIFKVA